MIDTFNLPNNYKTQIFYSNGVSNSWQTWTKPDGCTLVYMTLIGGGGGGGSGRNEQGASANPVGGGGGGSSSITTGLFQACLLPNTLFIQVGVGGSGGVSKTGASNGDNGTSGSLSHISVIPTAVTSNIVLSSGSVVASGGVGGGSGSGGGGGAGGSPFVFSTNPFSNLGIVNSVIGQSGSNGGTSVNTINDITITGLTTGGAGGGTMTSGSVYSGGSINGSGFINKINGGRFSITGTNIVGSASTITSITKENGSSGYFYLPSNSMRNPMFFLGGAGGSCGSNVGAGSGNAGFGGDGSFGSGGGGGGGSWTSPDTSGRGGEGGDGLVIITCW